jgi:hypothetical protein
MDEEDKPKSMWEATQRFMLEGTNSQYWLAYKANHPGLFEPKEEPRKPVAITPPSKPKVVLKPLVCKRCDCTWTPCKEQLPVQCPKCNSPYWNRERAKRK